MAGITIGGIRTILTSPKSSNHHPLVGAYDILVNRGRKRHHRERRRPQQRENRHQQHHHQQQRTLVSTNVFLNRVTYATETFPAVSSRNTIHVHPESILFPASNRRYVHGSSGDPSMADSPSSSSSSSFQPATNTKKSSNDEQQQQQQQRPPKSDPTAKRPTPKCDPYGLQGESLSRVQCFDWLSTLEDGWVLQQQQPSSPTNPSSGANNETDTSPSIPNENINDDTTATIDDDATHIREQPPTAPTYLQKQYHHRTFYEASQFSSRIAMLATNLDHYPFISMERILVDDLNDFCKGNDHDDDEDDDDDGARHPNSHGEMEEDGNTTSTATTKRKKGKIKGWAFRSTVRCSTYRPPTAGSAVGTSPRRKSHGGDASGEFDGDRGLTYHDFHLAMSVDVEANREEVRGLLWSNRSRD